MAVLRKKNKEQYTVVPQTVMKDKRLSLKDIGLLVSMLSLPDDWEFSENGLETIFENDGQASIRTGLKHLEEAGYLKRTRTRSADGKMGSVEWLLSEYPAFEKPHLEKPHLENPNVVNPSLENPSLENPPQVITKEVITKEVITKEEKENADALASTDGESSLTDEFESLWKLYPRKEGKSNALKAYLKARKDKKHPTTEEEVRNGIIAYCKYLKATKTEHQYIKHGGTWFYQHCWLDDYTGGAGNGSSKRFTGTDETGQTRIGANYL